MDIKIYKNLEFTDMIFDFDRLETSVKFCDYGSFRLLMKEYLDLNIDDILIINGRSYFVEDIYKYKNLSNVTKYEIVGRCVNSLLERRVLPNELVISAERNIESEIRSLITSAFISSGDRKVLEFELAAVIGALETFSHEVKFSNKSIGRVISEMLSKTKLGYRIDFDATRKKFVFRLIDGTDRANEVFFSEEYDNLSDSELSIVSRDLVNVAYKDGVSTGSSSGLSRREGYEIKDVKRKIEARMIPTPQYTYKEDWNLGDIVFISDIHVGFKEKRQITEVKEFFSNGYDMEVVFGGE